jgi:hypothetical protein
MASQRLSDEDCRGIVDALAANGGNQTATARALGLTRNQVQHRLNVAAARGMLGFKPVLPGFRISQTTSTPQGDFVQQKPEHGDEFAVPAGHVVKGVSALVDPDGREIVKWIKTKEGVLDPLQVVEWIKEAFTDFVPDAPSIVPDMPAIASPDLLTLIPLPDFHLGMYGWHREVGENWDLDIAERKIGAALDSVIRRSRPSGTAVVLGGGDLLHSDTNDNKTAKSGNALQVDGRYQKCVGVACRLLVRTVDSALARHGHVIIRILPGNHDEHAAVAVAYFLAAWYRNDPRVTVDTDPSLFWWHRFGLVLLGATHGHTVKMDKMPAIMAHRRAEDWGATRYRYVHGFHLHHKEKTATEGEGVVTEIHQAPIPQDAWHYGAGFLSGRSVKAITYHRELGEFGFVREPIEDATKAAPVTRSGVGFWSV